MRRLRDRPHGLRAPPKAAKKFTSVKNGPSNHENQVNNLTLQFMEVWRRAPHVDSEEGDTSASSSHNTELATSPNRPVSTVVKSMSQTALHRVRMLKFLRATTQKEAQVLDLRGANLKHDDFVSVSVVLTNHPTICTIDVRGNEITDLIVRLLTAVVEANRFLTDIFVDDCYLTLPAMEHLAEALEGNRAYVKEERKRRWIAAEARLYEESVAEFVAVMETFFVAEMRRRHDMEELEWDRRKEIVLHKMSHKKKAVRRQKARRTMEMVLERLEIAVEREAEFRKLLKAEWLRGVVRLSVELETSARSALCGEELRLRVACKGSETKDWVAARRQEKTRKEHESGQRWAIEVAEKEQRAKRSSEADAAMEGIAVWAERDRDQALAAESVRLEKERREAIQRRKEADAAREKREREEKEAATQLLRLKIEQRKERERFDVDATVARKRIMSERSTFFRGVEERWAAEWHMMSAHQQLKHAYDAMVLLVQRPVDLVLVTNTKKQKLYAALEKEVSDTNAEAKFRPVVPHISLRFDPPSGWAQAVATSVADCQRLSVLFDGAVLTAKQWRADGGDAGDGDGTGDVARRRSTAMQPPAAIGSSMSLEDDAPAPALTSPGSTVLGAPQLPAHPLHVALMEWSCDHIRTFAASAVAAMPFLAFRSFDDVLLWKTNVLSTAVTLQCDSACGHDCEVQFTIDPRLFCVDGGEGAPACACVDKVGVAEEVYVANLQPSQSIRIVSSVDAKIISDVEAVRHDVTPQLRSVRRGTYVGTPPPFSVTPPQGTPHESSMSIDNTADDEAPPECESLERPPEGDTSPARALPQRHVTDHASLVRAASFGTFRAETQPGTQQLDRWLNTPAILEVLRSVQMRFTLGLKGGKHATAVRRRSTPGGALPPALRVDLAVTVGDRTSKGHTELTASEQIQ